MMTLLGSVMLLLSLDADEFPEQSNGLIYDSATIARLRDIVLQEERNFLACPPTRAYQSLTYRLVDHLVFEADEPTIAIISEALAEVDSAEEATALFEDSLILQLRDMPVVRHENHHGQVYWQDPILGNQVDLEGRPEGAVVILKQAGYLLGSNAAVVCAYFPKGQAQSEPLPETYTHMVEYVDCMVGQNPVFSGDPNQGYRQVADSEPSDLARFADYLNHEPPPQLDWSRATEEERTSHSKQFAAWEAARFAWIHDEAVHTAKFKELLQAAASEALAKGTSTWELEDLTATYLSKETALAMMRARQVVGQCSMDDSPRRHARRMAQLAAETANWEIFLRAHLNILNDRFERVSDGSYAWDRRKTYFRELEALGLDLPDLVAGMALRVADASTNHYFGSTGRLGRALTGSDDPRAVLDPLLVMIADPDLDPPNAVQLSLVVLGYLTWGEPASARAYLTSIEAGGMALPAYVLPMWRHFLP